jgi:DNA-binding NarL/FixJ family response regulator
MRGEVRHKMEACRVVVANEPRLLRSMLNRVIRKVRGLQVVAEVSDLATLPSTVEETNAQWVIVSMWPDGSLPARLRGLLATHPDLCRVGVAADGSQARVRRPGSPERVMHSPSLRELIVTLTNEAG